MAKKSTQDGNWRGRIRIWTSGWHYRGWVGDFYPPGIRMQDLLETYIQSFRTVEINNSFYRLPAESTLAAWRDTVPRDFRFAVKASRFITHMKKLKDSGDSFRLFFDRVQVLAPTLGPILFQLPPRWRYDGERLEGFLAALPPGQRFAFEFRDPDWLRPEAFALLRRHGAAFCLDDWEGRKVPTEVTAEAVFVRFHGPLPGYHGSYSRAVLEQWAERMRKWAEAGLEVWAYFNNDADGAAPHNALTMSDLLEG